MEKSNLKMNSRRAGCPVCGADLVIRRNKVGLFNGCSEYPVCSYFQPLGHQSDGNIVKILEGSHCPDCRAELALRQGKFGMYICCTAWPECQYSTSIDTPDETNIPCPECQGGEILQRRSRFGKIFYACSAYPDCHYVINSVPVRGVCKHCGFNLLIVKQHQQGDKYFCANKRCAKPAILDQQELLP